MSDWSLSQLLASLHEDIQQRLATARKAMGHPGSKGDASEAVWLKLLETYLPRRYSVARAHVVDSRGAFSDQIDVVIFDRQYSPFIFQYEGQTVIPAESVYAAFEAKQTIDAQLVEYAQKKLATVRALHRTSLPIPHAGGTYAAKQLPKVLGGILALESEWNPPLGVPLWEALSRGTSDDCLDLGCIAAHGVFALQEDGAVTSSPPRGSPRPPFFSR